MESSTQENKQLTAVVGVNWGDEGKGRMVDLLSEDADIVVRYQGGNNAGHTIIVEGRTFVLHLLPSGILHERTVNVMGPGMVIDIQNLCEEIEALRAAGIRVTPDTLRISDRAVICMPYDVRQDVLEEERLADRKYGSTKRGIAPVYGDKYMKKAIRMGDLLYPAFLPETVENIVEWKNLMFEGGYKAGRIDAGEMLQWLEQWGKPLLSHICDTGIYLGHALDQGRSILFEAQLGALRDVDFGICPYTSSSTTLAAYGPIGAGIPGRRLDETIGVMKAYSTCVGEGPFVCELDGKEAERLREAGGEYGATTGRPRRVGFFDAVASRYGARMQGADAIALTKLDVLSGFDEIPVVTAYQLKDGTETGRFPTVPAMAGAQPVTKTLPGWKQDISGVRSWADLPKEAREYVEYLEKTVEVPVRYISVGPERSAYFVKEESAL